MRNWTGPRRAAVVLTCALGLSLAAGGCGPPQIGADRQAFREVDALYTAVSLRDAAQLDRCEASLRALRDAGKLPPSAADRLAAITAEARQGAWEPARQRLRGFIEGQRP